MPSYTVNRRGELHSVDEPRTFWQRVMVDDPRTWWIWVPVAWLIPVVVALVVRWIWGNYGA